MLALLRNWRPFAAIFKAIGHSRTRRSKSSRPDNKVPGRKLYIPDDRGQKVRYQRQESLSEFTIF